MKYICRVFLAVIWATISCPLTFATTCDFKMTKLKFYYQGNAKYKVNLNIREACSVNAIYKRSVRDIELNIYSHHKKLITMFFDDGFWMPSQSKFLLKTKRPFTKGCFIDSDSIMINLKSNVINSFKGHYFNLNSGQKLKVNCQSLNNT